jgi:hypothetical protein
MRLPSIMESTARIGGTNVTTANAARWSASMLASFLASQIAGAIMLAFLCSVYAVVYRAHLLQPLAILASFRYGEVALYFLSPVGYLWALGFHAGTCAIWGIVFGVLATLLRVDKSRWAPIALGLAIGLASQIVDVRHVPGWVSWMSHVVFGLGFAAFTPIFRSLWLRWSGYKMEA